MQRDELNCGAGRDQYIAGSIDYVDSSCEEGKLVDTGGPPLILLAGFALLSTGLLLSRCVIRRVASPRLQQSRSEPSCGRAGLLYFSSGCPLAVSGGSEYCCTASSHSRPLFIRGGVLPVA